MGTLKTTNIQTITGSGTLTLGTSGETVTVPSGVTVAGSMANTPAFMAYRSGSNQSISASTDTLVLFNSTSYNTGSAYDTSTGFFTVPSGGAGRYLFTVGLQTASITSSSHIAFEIDNGSSAVTTGYTKPDKWIDARSTDDSRITKTIIVNMNDGFRCSVKIYFTSSGEQITTNRSFFCGVKLIG
jgi:hypothetical protein